MNPQPSAADVASRAAVSDEERKPLPSVQVRFAADAPRPVLFDVSRIPLPPSWLNPGWWMPPY